MYKIKYHFLIFALYIYFLYLFSGLFLLIPISLSNFYDKRYGFFIKNIFYINIAFCLKYIYGTEIYINSNTILNELINEKDQIIVTQNHFSEIDYLFLSYIFTNLNSITKIFNFKYIYMAKKFVGSAFIGAGLFSFFTRDIYLVRDISRDHDNLVSNNNADILYMFPEGTCFNYNTKKISDEFIKKNNLMYLKYHLYPRLTGLFTLLKTHRAYKKIYDLTLTYDTIPKDKLGSIYKFHNFFTDCEFPTKIYMKIKKYNIKTNILFSNKIDLIYKNKDKFIESFDQNQNFFKKINFNLYVGFGSFIFSNIIGLFSLYLFFSFSFIKLIFVLQIVLYLAYFNLN